jgi:putative phosphoesterase
MKVNILKIAVDIRKGNEGSGALRYTCKRFEGFARKDSGRPEKSGLRELSDFKGVYGNMDADEIKRELPDKDIFEIGGVRIGITHPSEGGSPFGLRRRVKSKLGEKLDLVIYGHSHKPANEREGNTICFNPGSATGAFPARYKTYGVLRIGDEIEVEIVRIYASGKEENKTM